MEYKIGDVVYVSAEVEDISQERTRLLVKFFNPFDDTKVWVDKKRVSYDNTTGDYTAGMRDAWETAYKIISPEGVPVDDMADLFGTRSYTSIFEQFSAAEAKAKIDVWEESRIQVGDVVQRISTKTLCGLVLSVNDETCTYLSTDASTYMIQTGEVEKTGRHIDAEGLLRQIGGAE